MIPGSVPPRKYSGAKIRGIWADIKRPLGYNVVRGRKKAIPLTMTDTGDIGSN